VTIGSRLRRTARAAPLFALGAAGVLFVCTAFDFAAPQQDRPPDAPIIKITGAATEKVPIAIPRFDGGGTPKGDEAASLLYEVLRDDLLFSNYFKLVPDEYLKLVPAFAGRKTDYKEWQGIGADAVLIGTAALQPPDLVFEARVYDMSEQRLALGKKYRASPDQGRLLAHRMADEIILRYTGKPGIATSRITYVSQVGKGKEIFVMDYDGARVKKITANNSINLSPSWSPDGQWIAFMSYRSGSPELKILSSKGELRSAFPQKGELNSAPSWSPDGKLLAFSSGRDGNAEIYTLRPSDGSLTRLTRDAGIDTSPTWSPDGHSLAFTSDRSGSPQIWLMDSDGGNVRRLNTELSYCDAPSWNPVPEEDESIAFTARVPGGFDIYVYDLKERTIKRVTDGGGINEWPRWSPDGRHLVFASNRSGGFDVYTMDADGDHVRRLTRGGSNTSPSWAR
jgi:TolB protein